MRKFLLTAAAAVCALGADTSAALAAQAYHFEDYGDEVRFWGGRDGDFSVYERNGGKNCGGDSWRGFLANIYRDTSGVVWVQTRRCGRNLLVCVDVEDSGTVFKPHVCATLGWSR